MEDLFKGLIGYQVCSNGEELRRRCVKIFYCLLSRSSRHSRFRFVSLMPADLKSLCQHTLYALFV